MVQGSASCWLACEEQQQAQLGRSFCCMLWAGQNVTWGLAAGRHTLCAGRWWNAASTPACSAGAALFCRAFGRLGASEQAGSGFSGRPCLMDKMMLQTAPAVCAASDDARCCDRALLMAPDFREARAACALASLLLRLGF